MAVEDPASSSRDPVDHEASAVFLMIVEGMTVRGKGRTLDKPGRVPFSYHRSMKTTVEIPDAEIEELLRHTGARTKRDAIVTAIIEFNRRRRLENLAEQLGTFDSVMSVEELLGLRENDQAS